MSKFFDKIKDAFSSKKTQKYKIYDGQQIKIVAMKTRIILTERMELLFKAIKAEDQKFKYVGQDSRHIYAILQSVGDKVIEAESTKILIEMLRKIQNNASNIAKTNGDISLLKVEIGWYQCILWYRRQKQIGNLEDIHAFCLDFFKGVDITKQVDVNCEVFKVYPIMKYLEKGIILPMPEVLFYMQPYVSCSIDQPTLDAVFSINKEHIANKATEPDRYSLNDPKQKYSQSSHIAPSSQIYSPSQQSIIGPNNSFKPQQLPQKFVNPSANTNSSIGSINNNHANTNPWPKPYQQSTNPWNAPQKQSSSTANNTLNVIGNNPAFNTYSNDVSYSNYPLNPQQNIATQDHNPFSNSRFRNTSQTTQPQPNSYTNPYHNPPQEEAVKHQPSPTKPNEAPKKSFFNTLMRTNSLIEQQRLKNDPYSAPQGLSIDRERQANDFRFNQTNESQLPFNRQSQQSFGNTHNQPAWWQIQQKEQRLRQQQQRKAEEQRRRDEMAREQERRLREQEEVDRALQAQLILREQTEKKHQEQLQRQKQMREKEEADLRKEKQLKMKQLQEIQRIKRQFEQSQRLMRQKEERERQIELERQQEEARLQVQRQARLRERESQEERELNVFVDNEREGIDRGYSGRFSSSIGFKYDFGDEQREDFNYSATNPVNSSLLKFSEEAVIPPASQAVDYELIDGSESMGILEKHWPLGESPGFKLFYSKRVK